MHASLKRLLALLVASSILVACGGSSDSSSSASSTSSVSIAMPASPADSSEDSSASSSAVSSSASSESSVSSSASSSETSVSEEKTPDPVGKEFTWKDIPPYDGKPSVTVNNNVPFFEPGEETANAFQHYFDLDNLGRVTLAYASLGPELQPEEERGDISSVHPTGFVNEEYPFVEDGYVYNRCHLIAFMLAGQNANPKNLMTGTRYMNVEGMLPYEKKTDDYIDRTDNHVMYRVTPIFKDDELVARGVLMEAKSVEDKGTGLQFCVFCYNVQPGVAINYADGTNHADGSIAVGAPASEAPAPAPAPAPSSNGSSDAQAHDYVLNTNTHKFHYPDCKSVKKMKAKNRQDVHETRDQVIAQGYDPCGICHP